MFLLLWLYFLMLAESVSKPNIVWFLTDDQDQVLGGSFPQLNGVGPMPKTKALLAEQGLMADNFYIHTPICNPSRSELLTGRYFHNIKGVKSTWDEMNVNESKVLNYTFLRELKEKAGYTTGMFGKFLNKMPVSVPIGFDAWMANPGGKYIAPQFQLYNVIDLIPGLKNNPKVKCWSNGEQSKNHSGDPGYGCFKGTKDPSNYSTSVIGNASMAWIEQTVQNNPDQPFFAYIAPKAAHEPFMPAPWYRDYWNVNWPEHEPRPEIWNCSAESRKDHHGNIATESLLNDKASRVITDVFKNRWRTLMSVDDIIADVVALCERLGIMDNTYFFYSSDHGFQLGEFNILMDKRQVYEWNTKIHLLVRGPGIPAGSRTSVPATQVDLTPTFLGLAGIERPSHYDGRSLVPFLISETSSNLSMSTRTHLQSLPPIEQYTAGWRDTLFFEYYWCDDNDKCLTNCIQPYPAKNKGYPNADVNCGDLTPGHNTDCWGGSQCNETCYPTETIANNYIAIRTMPWSSFGDMLYAEFQTGVQSKADINFDKIDFVEMYDVRQDPWMMNNIAISGETHADIEKLHEKLHDWYNCGGDTCF